MYCGTKTLSLLNLVTEGSQFLSSFRFSRSSSGSSDLSVESLLLGVVFSRSDLSLFFQLSDDVFVFPADRGGQLTQSSVLSTWLQSQNSQSLWNDNSLLLVVWRWDTFKDLQTFHGSLTTSSLVSNHTTDSLVEDSRWGSEVEWTTVFVESSSLSQVIVVLQLVSEEFTRDVQSFGSNNNDLLTVQ